MADEDRFDNPLDLLGMEEEEAEEVEEQPVQRTPSRKKGVSQMDAKRATGKDSVVAGDYLRYTFTWTPRQLELVEQVARENGFSKNATARWLLDQGLLAYFERGVEPELEEGKLRPEPKLEEW